MVAQRHSLLCSCAETNDASQQRGRRCAPCHHLLLHHSGHIVACGPAEGVLCQKGVCAALGVVPQGAVADGVSVHPGVVAVPVVGGACDHRGTGAFVGLPTLSCEPGEGGKIHVDMPIMPGEDGGTVVHMDPETPGDVRLLPCCGQSTVSPAGGVQSGIPDMPGEVTPISIDIGRAPPRSIDIGRAPEASSAEERGGGLSAAAASASGIVTVTPCREEESPESGGDGEWFTAAPESLPNRFCSFSKRRCRSWLTSSSP